MTKKFKNGFTLIELIVVMAVFSILMVGIMALTGPVSRLFKNTAIAEKTYSYANNIQVYLQGKLEYSEAIAIYTSDMIPDVNSNSLVDNDDLRAIAEKFRSSHYHNTVVSSDGINAEYLKGKVHITRLLNKDDASDTSLKRGQITHRVYDFVSNSPISLTPIPSEEVELNPAYFDATDSAYNFSYSLGATKFRVVDTPSSGDSDIVYRALDRDFSDRAADISPSTLALSIVIDKKSNGSIDVPAGTGTNAYRAFASPSALQIATLPLTNIMSRNGKAVIRPKSDDLSAVELQGTSDYGKAFDINPPDPTFVPQVGFDNDIYFVYSYTDELG